MPIYEFEPGEILPIQANQIPGNLTVYRQTNVTPGGMLAWEPSAGSWAFWSLSFNPVVTIPVNGIGGVLTNTSNNTLQLIWAAAATRSLAPTPFLRAQLRGFKNRAASGDDSLTAAMQKLTAQWYNAIIAGCGLDAATFQLVQGNAPLGTTSETLWNLFDAVPPMAINNYFDPSQMNDFSTDYGGVIANLKPQNAQSFMTIMGDYYSLWTAYLHTNPTIPTGGILQLFYNWSQLNLDPNTAQNAYTAFQQISQGAVPSAMELWLNAGGAASGTKAYNATIMQLQNAIASGKSCSFKVDSNTSSSDISHSWAKAEGGFVYDIFEIGGEGSYDHLSSTLITSGLSFDVTFDKLVTFTAGPLAKASTDPILSLYKPWYSSSALNLAYQNNNNNVWQNSPPSWDDTFGPNGNVLRTASAIIVVDGITVVTTSQSSVDKNDQTEVTSAVEGGIFPFFEASGEGGWSHQTTFDDSGTMTVTSSCAAGNPQILGVVVTPIASSF